jgi:hypothetical protein
MTISEYVLKVLAENGQTKDDILWIYLYIDGIIQLDDERLQIEVSENEIPEMCMWQRPVYGKICARCRRKHRHPPKTRGLFLLW